MTVSDLPLWAESKPPARSLAADYAKWKASPAGQLAWDEIKREALAQYMGGAVRLSINHISELVRAKCRVHMPNSYRPLLADSLCELYPQMDGVLKRNKRKVRPGL